MNPHWLPYLVGCTLMVALTLATNPLPRCNFKGESLSCNGVLNYDIFLLSKDKKTLYVGARDTIIAFDISNTDSTQFKAEIQWSPTSSKKEECALKGKSAKTECFNFIRVLVQLNETHLYTCGTYAFSPTCAYVDLKDFNLVKEKGELLLEKGKGVCPYDPQHRNTAILVDGELYTGTMNNFLGNEPIISRTLGSRAALKIEDHLNWLEQDAKFVSSFHLPDDDKVYFFFEETAKGSEVIDQYTVSRIARVCKNDIGGNKILQKKWTTFLKAQLSCTGLGQFPHTIIQDVFSLTQPGGRVVFYGVFDSQWQVYNYRTSAVCVFTLDAIKKAFDGRYKELNRINSHWMTYYGKIPDPRPGSCSAGPSSEKAHIFIKDHFLMDEKMAPIHQKHLYIAFLNGKYTRIAVHQTQNIAGLPYNVMFLATNQGHLHKVVILGSKAHVIEERVLFENMEAIQNLLLIPEKGILCVGYSEGVLLVPFARCGLYVTCADCVWARDPYCAWDGEKCRNLQEGGKNMPSNLLYGLTPNGTLTIGVHIIGLHRSSPRKGSKHRPELPNYRHPTPQLLSRNLLTNKDIFPHL